MTHRTGRLFGIACLVVYLVGIATSTALSTFPPREDPVGHIALILALLAFPGVGALIVSRQPANAVGWIFCGIGFLVGVGTAGQAYAENVLPNLARPGPLAYAAAWIYNWWWYPLLGLAVIFTPLIFPTGRLLSRRWRFVFAIALISVGVVTLAGMLQPRLTATAEGDHEVVLYDLDNPIGIPGLGDPENGAIAGVFWGGLLIAMVGAVASMIVRFRRSRGVERQQLKWFTFAVAMFPVTILIDELVPIETGNLPFALIVGALPVSAGIAILKYRLYDIDVVINKTLVYGLLTGFLIAVYAGLVTWLQVILPTGGSEFAVAASTLSVAALFAPLRGRVQEFVDQRFYRRKYDAEKTIEAFSARLREEIDLETLTQELVAVVDETMQPTHVLLWFRRS